MNNPTLINIHELYVPELKDQKKYDFETVDAVCEFFNCNEKCEICIYFSLENNKEFLERIVRKNIITD
jgi:hypothetical protein